LTDSPAVPDVQVSKDIAADPSLVYDLVADVTRMGEWSPETTAARWVEGTAGTVGARFRGTNQHRLLRWTTTCTVTAADRGRRFAFDVSFGPWAISHWSYEFESTAAGCRVTESWSDRRPTGLRIGSPLVMGIADRPAHNRKGMEATLAALKAEAEARTPRRDSAAQ
jgi:ribosome-associated toxin RatA of RatAB toxin-antitoxin module